MQTRLLKASDAAWTTRLIHKRWSGTFVISRGKVHDTRKLPGVVASIKDRVVGLLLFARQGSSMEIVTLDALMKRKGVGRMLIKAACSHAAGMGVKKIRLVTSNDNVGAIAFYTRCGFRLTRIYPNAITKARKLKPGIPIEDEFGVPVRDELEFEKKLLNKTQSR